MKHYTLFTLLLFMSSFTCWGNNQTDEPPNVLFIMVDDLRVELGSYGGKHVLSPNIDKLAQQGTRFNNAYVSVPVCGASRASIFTGIRPTPNRFKNYYTRVEDDTPNATTLFELFKNNGYHTSAYGKIFHYRQDTAEKSWTSEKAWTPGSNKPEELKTGPYDYMLPANIAEYKETGRGPTTEIFDGPDTAYFDGETAVKAMEEMTALAQSSKPFFMAVGFSKPHLPFNAPKKYWDMYDANQFELAVDSLPIGAPQQAYHSFGELRRYSDSPATGPIGDAQARRLIHGYHAAVSYADAQVGLVLDKLDDLELTDNTIVVLMGDHGYSLGEHGLWAKHSTFDIATRTPLIIRAPNKATNKTVNGLVEFIDIFPTLTDLAGIKTPAQATGESLTKLLGSNCHSAKQAVFTRYQSAEAIRTSQYTLTQWFDRQNKVVAEMLYDNVNDPDETVNLAPLPEYEQVLNDIRQQLNRYIQNRQ